MTDQDLLRQFAGQGDREALAELVRRHCGMVHATALRELHDVHLADDATQAVFLVLMRRAKDLSPRVLLGGWLFKTTLYAVSDIRRQRKRRQYHEREAAQMNSAVTPGQTPAMSEACRLHLGQAIGALSAADREAIIIRYFEGRGAAEIALALGTSEETARQRLSRALAHLRKMLQRKGVTTAVAALAMTLESSTSQGAAGPLTSGLEALVHGAAPAPHIQTLATGVLKMISNAQKLFALTVAASGVAVLVLIAGGVRLLSPAAAPSDSAIAVPIAATTAPGTQPGPTAALKPDLSPQKTPKGTVLAALKAAQAGDAQALIGCFDTPSERQQAELRQVAAAFGALDDVGRALGEKFGPDARLQFQLRGPMSIDPAEFEHAGEIIEGNAASVDIGGSGPGTVEMVKRGDVWKVDAGTLNKMDAGVPAQIAQFTPQMKQLAADIRAGKYQSPAELMTIVQNMMNGPRTRAANAQLPTLP